MGTANTPPSPGPTPAPTAPHLGEVRYNLAELLNELQIERTQGSFAQEKLHQAEISKLFKNRKKRGVAPLA